MFEKTVEKARIRWYRAKANAKRKADEAIIWVRRNPDVVAVAVPVAIATVKGASRIVSKAVARANMEKANRDLRTRCYDPSEGHYWFLKRELSNSEWLLVNRRHTNGEKIGDILAEMKVLK